jgi:molybdopterin molybdotransferase
MITIDQALEQVLEACPDTLGNVVIPIHRAVGRVLVDALTTSTPHPGFDKVMMDGYAVSAAEVRAGVTLLRIGECPAGAPKSPPVKSGTCVEVMTGGPLPPGATAVVPVEQTTRSGDAIHFAAQVKAGQHVAMEGSSTRQGEVILPAGSVVTPIGIAALAAEGRSLVRVRRNPSLAVVTTGDELVPIDHEPGPHQIRDSNGVSLATQALCLGLDKITSFRASDDPIQLRDTLEEALSRDLVVVAGGVSRGKYDRVPETLEDLGVQCRFHKVLQKPGKPLWFGTRERTLVFGAPGNPLATVVAFQVYVTAAVAKMTGQSPTPPHHRGVLSADARYHSKRDLFAMVTARWCDDHYEVTARQGSGSADVFATAAANALLPLPAGDHALRAGQEIQFQLIPPGARHG